MTANKCSNSARLDKCSENVAVQALAVFSYHFPDYVYQHLWGPAPLSPIFISTTVRP